MHMTDVVIVGTGPAGIRAAETLVKAGLRPVVIDESCAVGGQIYRQPPLSLTRPPKQLYGADAKRAVAAHARFDALRARIDYRPDSFVWGGRDGVLDLVSRDLCTTVPWQRLILATGAMDRVLPFAGWTLSGVYSLGGAQVALKGQAAAIGRHVVLLGTGPLLYLVAYQYAKAGIAVAAILDTAPLSGQIRALPGLLLGGSTFLRGLYYLSWLRAHRIAVHTGVEPLAALSDTRGSVRALRWKNARGEQHETPCDAIGFGYGLRSETQLADLLKLEFVFDPRQRQWLPRQSEHGRASGAGVYLAGDGARVMGADVADLAGERAACALLVDLGRTDYQARLQVLAKRIRRAERFRDALDNIAFPFPHQHVARAADDMMICRCEGITVGALRSAARTHGARELNRAKALSRTGMGRCQGRVCGAAAAEILATELRVGIEQVGRFRGQSPVKPISLAALAGGAAG
jgi:hydrogen cyanide synthase HcnB